MLKELESIIDTHDKILILSGAGVSADSGIATFRGDTNSIYQSSNAMGTIFDRRIFNYGSHLDMFNEMFDSSKLIPSKAHKFAVDLDNQGKLLGVVTQNVDRLYEQAGLMDKRLVHIHGVADTMHCVNCKGRVTKDMLFMSKSNKYHSTCCGSPGESGGLVDTDMVLFGDDFDYGNVRQYRDWLLECDLLLVMGTTLDITYHRDIVSEFIVAIRTPLISIVG